MTLLLKQGNTDNNNFNNVTFYDFVINSKIQK